MDANTRTLIQAVLPALAQPPPDVNDYLRQVTNALLIMTRLPPDPLLDVRFRLSAADINHYGGRDVFQLFAAHRYQFYEMTGETPETLIQLSGLIEYDTVREHTLSSRNRILLFMFWLRSYPTHHMLSALFCVSTTTVRDEIRAMRPLFERKLKTFVVWPSEDEWRNMSGRWCKIPNAVGAIDGTSHEIYRPSVEPQKQYYSGHRQYHGVHTQVVVDNEGIIRFVQSGFLRHMNDAQQIAMMQRTGTDLVFPHDCFLLGEKIYPNRYPIIIPFSAGQVARRHGRDRRRCVKFNRYVSSCRIIVEHSIGELKTYRTVSTIWRHPRYLLPSVVVICAGLVCRRKELNLIL